MMQGLPDGLHIDIADGSEQGPEPGAQNEVSQPAACLTFMQPGCCLLIHCFLLGGRWHAEPMCLMCMADGMHACIPSRAYCWAEPPQSLSTWCGLVWGMEG